MWQNQMGKRQKTWWWLDCQYRMQWLVSLWVCCTVTLFELLLLHYCICMYTINMRCYISDLSVLKKIQKCHNSVFYHRTSTFYYRTSVHVCCIWRSFYNQLHLVRLVTWQILMNMVLLSLGLQVRNLHLSLEDDSLLDIDDKICHRA